MADPRRTALAEKAKVHLQLKVGSDIALLNGLCTCSSPEDLYDKEYVAGLHTNFDELKNAVMKYTPESAADICGVDAETIRRTARHLASVKPLMLIYTLGITEHTSGVNNVMSRANLQMLLGNVGFECGGVNPLRGQNNVQGACDMGALPNVFPGYQPVTDLKARAKFEAAWGVGKLPDKVGKMMPTMMSGLLDGSIRFFYVFGENLANTEPDIHHVEKCLASAEFLVCQDIFPTETTRFAHVILPAAGMERKRRDVHQQRAARQQGADCERPARCGQAKLVDIQGDRTATRTTMGIRQRAGIMGQRDIRPRPEFRGHQICPHRR